MQSIAIIGAGGFAREVEWLIRDLNAVHERFKFVGYLVDDPTQSSLSASQILGDYSWLERNPGGVQALALGIGTPSARIRLSAELQARFPELAWPTLIHPSVCMDWLSASVGQGAILCANVVGTVNVSIGDFAMVNLACTLGHETTIGKGSVLNPTVNLSGGVTLGAGVLVGTGAQVLQYHSVGDGATVGAGAVVSKSVAQGLTVVGIPARPLVKQTARPACDPA